MNQKIWTGALALSICLVSGCANAQPKDAKPTQPNLAQDPDAEQPQPEAVKGPPEAVAPAPFRNTIWRAGQTGKLLLSGPLAGYVGPLAVNTFGGRKVWSGEAKAGQSEIEIAVSQTGYYRLNAGNQSYWFGVVPVPVSKTDEIAGRTIWGVNTHFGQRDTPDEAYEMLQIVGIDAVRDELGWGPLEKEKGVYTFIDRHVDYTSRLKKHGIPLWFSASYGNPLYPVSGKRHPAAGAAVPFANYVVKELEKFGDNIIGVEILNEPNKVKPVVDYMPVLQETYKQVRAAGFKQPIIAVGGAGPAGGGMAPGFAREIYKRGSAKFSDGFSQHPYMSPFTPDTGYAGGQANLDVALTRAADIVKKYGLKGSWITELGWAAIPLGITPTPEQLEDRRSARTMVSDAQQAAFTARSILIASKYPTFKGMFVYDFQDDGPIDLRREHRFGLVKQDLQPKMSFQSFAMAANFVKDKKFVSAYRKDDSLLSANFYRAKNGDLWAAVWSIEVTRRDAAAEKAGTIALPPRSMELQHQIPFRFVGAAARSALDWQGAPLPARPTGAATSLPIYVNLGRVDSAKIEPVGAEPKIALPPTPEATAKAQPNAEEAAGAADEE